MAPRPVSLTEARTRLGLSAAVQRAFAEALAALGPGLRAGSERVEDGADKRRPVPAAPEASEEAEP